MRRRLFSMVVGVAVASGCSDPRGQSTSDDAGADVATVEDVAAPLDRGGAEVATGVDVQVDRATPMEAAVAMDVPVVMDVALDRGGSMEAAVTVDAGVDRPAMMEAAVVPDAGPIVTDTGPDVVSPRTTLRVRYPASALSLRGDLAGALTWTQGIAFQRVSDGVFEWSREGVTGAFEWKPLLGDMTWSRGPNYRATPGTTTEVTPHFTTVIGRWSRAFEVSSTTLGNTRGVWIYLPPSYDENPAIRFPVVYLHDGQNLFDPNAAFGGQTWRAHDAMNAGAEDALIREAILVGVENTSARIEEYTPTRDATRMAGGRGDTYLTFLRDVVKPQIDRTYRTLTGREDTVLLGSSLGGLISAYAGVRYAETFGSVGILSPSTWWDGRMILREVASVPMRSSRPLRVYIDSGDSGPSNDDVTNTRDHADAWRAVGYRDGLDFRYVVRPGAEHNEAAWAERLPGCLQFLLGPRR